MSPLRSSHRGHQLPLRPGDVSEDGEADDGGREEGRAEGSLHDPAAGVPHS